MKIIESKNKIKIEIPNLDNLNYNTISVKELILTDSNNTVTLYLHGKDMISKNGQIVFPNVKNTKEIIERYSNFRDTNTFWKNVLFNETISSDQKINNRKVFGNRNRQDEMLEDIGIKYNLGNYYCNFTYFFDKLYKFDVFKIDKKLKEIYFEYTSEMSMKEFIIQVKGEEFAKEFEYYFKSTVD